MVGASSAINDLSREEPSSFAREFAQLGKITLGIHKRALYQVFTKV